MATVIRKPDIDATTRSLSTLERVDYVYFVSATTSYAPGKSPEQLARALVQDAAGLSGQFTWRVILGLRLASPGSPEHVAGWKIARRGDGWITLEASSWFLSANV